MKAKNYLLTAGLALSSCFAFSQVEPGFKVDTTLFNYSYWNGLADKRQLSNKDRIALINELRQAEIQEQKNRWEHKHDHSDDKDLVWVTHPQQQGKFGSASTFAGPCTNIGFETGNMSGWVRSTGFNPLYTPNPSGCCATANGDQSITSGTGVDPFGGFPIVYPGGGFSLRLGSTGTGGRADRIEQTFFVTPSNANFTYRYAVVLNHGGTTHSVTEHPKFEIEMVDTTGAGIPCTFYQVSAATNTTGYQVSNLMANGTSVLYKPWTSVIIDLTPNIGQNVTLRFTVYDCAPGGHFAYAYIDGLCTNFDLNVNDTSCVNTPKQICGPLGFGSYEWNGPGVVNNPNQCITPTNSGVYVCTTTLVPGCPGPIFTHTVNINPIPVISFTPVGVLCGTQYSFNSTASVSAGSIASYSYNFGDNTGSTLPNPTHIYAPGVYAVKLKAITSLGCQDSVIQNVTIHPTPQISFSPPSHCINTAVQFTNTTFVPPATGLPPGFITSYIWNFGNGQTSPLPNPLYTYTTSGAFIVTLTAISDQSCIASATQTLNIFPPPVLSFTANPLCDIFGSAFTPATSNSIATGSIVSYYWQFGDGGTSTLQNPVHIYNTPGNYIVTLTGTSNHNCISTKIDTLQISPTPTMAFSTFSLNACSPQFTFNNTSTGSSTQQWTFFGPTPTNTVGSTLLNPTHTFPGAGTYTVRLIGTSNMGCSDTLSQLVTIYPLPVVSVSVPASCESAVFTVSTTAPTGSVTSYAWDFGDPGSGANNTSNLQNPTHSYGAVGIYTISLAIISNQNCPSLFTNTITVSPNPDPGMNFFPPDACITTYSFLNTSGIVPPISGNSIVSQVWNFGGSNTSTLNAPVYNFPGPGSYTVTLSNTTNNNCSASITKTLTIHPYPTASVNVAPTCLNTAAIFNGFSNIAAPGSIISHTWNFGDNSFDNSNFSPTHMYAASGPYTVSFAITSDNGCVSTKTANIQVYPLPNFNFTYINTCAGSPVTFTNNTTMPPGYSITGYKWDFESDGIVNSTMPSPAFTYPAYGQYTVQLHATTSNNCVDSSQQVITIHDLPTPAITIDNVCAGQSTAFTGSLSQGGFNSQITSYSWNFGDNSSIATTQTGVHTYQAPGVYSVQLTAVNNNNCSRSTTSLVSVHHLPVVNFTANNVCLNASTSFNNLSTIGNPDQIVKWRWDFGNGWEDSLSHSPTKTFGFSGSYPIKLQAISNNNCVAQKVINVSVYGNPVANFSHSTICVGDNIAFQNQSSTIDGTITAYNWDFNGDGSVDQETINPVYSYTMNGNFMIRLNVITNYGCEGTATRMINANPKPIPLYSSDAKTGCPELCVNFNNLSYISSGSFTSMWDFGDGSPVNNFPSPSHCYNEGDFDVRLTLRSDSGCRSVLFNKSFVKVYANPKADFSVWPEMVDEEDPTITISNNASADATNIRYYISDGTSFGTSNFTHSIKNMGSKAKPMIVQIVKNNEGCVDTLYKVLEIKPAFTIYVPDAFTPNGDGTNDSFQAKGVGITKFAMQIFDRWGHLMWTTNELTTSWDGTVNGNIDAVKQDVYTWKAQVVDVFNKTHDLIGRVTVIK